MKGFKLWRDDVKDVTRDSSPHKVLCAITFSDRHVSPLLRRDSISLVRLAWQFNHSITLRKYFSVLVRVLADHP